MYNGHRRGCRSSVGTTYTRTRVNTRTRSPRQVCSIRWSGLLRITGQLAGRCSYRGTPKG